MAFGHFRLGSHNYMVTALGLCVKWTLLGKPTCYRNKFPIRAAHHGSSHKWDPHQACAVQGTCPDGQDLYGGPRHAHVCVCVCGLYFLITSSSGEDGWYVGLTERQKSSAPLELIILVFVAVGQFTALGGHRVGGRGRPGDSRQRTANSVIGLASTVLTI